MPLVDYACPKCKQTYEALQKTTEPQEHACPSCGGKMEKQLSVGTAFQLKGDGWFRSSNSPLNT